MSHLTLVPYEQFLPLGNRRRIAVLADPTLGSKLNNLLQELRRDDVFVLAARRSRHWRQKDAQPTYVLAGTTSEIHQRLRAIGPLDVIVDLLPSDSEQGTDLWRATFFHLRPGGVYVLADESAFRAVTDATSAGRIDRLISGRWLGDAKHRTLPIEDELTASLGQFHLAAPYLFMEKRLPHLLKVRDSEVVDLFAQRNIAESIDTLATLPAGKLVCRGEVISHEAAVPISNLQLQMKYPELHTYHYKGSFSLIRNSLVYSDSMILPGSFRYPLTKTLGNPRLREITPDFSRVPPDLVPDKTLVGDFYHLDCWNTGHFGHVITEVVSRLWGWHEAKRRLPDLKAIFRRRQPGDAFPQLEVSLFTAYGIDRSDIVWVDEPVRVESLVTATSMWQNGAPYYVHPELVSTWQLLRSTLVTTDAESPRKIFVSRRPTLKNRACRNIAAVEDVFARAGFAIVFPEELSFAQQATVFGNAEVVAGFAGSGLYNVLYCEHLTDLLVLSQEAYTARYEHLYTMVLGCRTHYFWSTPDQPHPVGGWSEDAYYSSWEFDFVRNSAMLDNVLASV